MGNFKEREMSYKVYKDEFPTSPREEGDNLGIMICFHKRYNLGDRHDYKFTDFSSWEDMEYFLSEGAKVILPLYLYDHSGLSISTEPFSCPWDSGQVGFIIATEESIKRCMGWKRITKNRLEAIKTYLIGEVETYNQYLNGEVYAWTTFDEQGNELDSCYRHYCEGHAIEDAKENLKYHGQA